MRAVLCERLDGPAGLRLAEVPAPAPGPGEVAVAVAAAGVNFADRLLVEGRYQERPHIPFSPGLEVAGTVRAVGEGVSRVAVGEAVMAVLDHGGFAEVAIAREADVFARPAGMEVAVAAGFPIAYGTAHGALVWRAELQAGETLLVNGAAGGAGLAAVEVGKALGATVIAAAGGPERLAVARAHGADHAIDYRSEDVRARVKELTEGRGADAVFDPVGGPAFEAALRAAARGGRLVVVGFAGGTVQRVRADLVLVKNLSVLGLYWGAYRRRAPDLVAAQFATLADWYAEGRLAPRVSHTLDLAEAARALDLLAERTVTGKIVLTVGGD